MCSTYACCKLGSLVVIAFVVRGLSSSQVIQRAGVFNAKRAARGKKPGHNLLPHWSVPSGTLQAVYVSRRGMVPAVRAFLDFLDQHLGAGT